MKRSRALVVLLLLVSLVAASCGREDEGSLDTGETPTTEDAAVDEACEGATLEATEVGITAETITVQVMADIGSPLAPGLFQGNVDAMNAFAEFVNDNGGIACRDLVVETWDTKLNAEESKNGLINACRNAVAIVGSNALFNPDVTPMSGCVDKAGKVTGLPDISALATDVNQQCNATTFVIQAVAETCPITQGRPRPLRSFVGVTEYYRAINDELHGIFLVPGDLPTTVQSATVNVASMQQAGITWDAVLKASGRDPQAAYTPKVQELKSAKGSFVYNGSNDATMTNMMKETKAQGYDGVEIWACSLACYTRAMLKGGSDVEGAYVWMQFLPFEEADSNEALRAYVDGVGEDEVDSFGAQAWQAGMLFEHVVDKIVEADGPNAVTRARIIEELKVTDDFNADGWMGAAGKNLRGMSTCMVIMQIEGGEFVRRFPEKTGTLSCKDEYVVTITLDPAVEAAKIR